MPRHERTPVKMSELWGLYDVETGRWIDAPITQSDAILAYRSYDEALVGLRAEVFYEAELDGYIGKEAEVMADAAVAHVGAGGQPDRIPEDCVCDAPSQASRLRIARLV